MVELQLIRTHREILKFLSRNITASMGTIAANITAVAYGSLKNHVSMLEGRGLVSKSYNDYVTVSITAKGQGYLRGRA